MTTSRTRRTVKGRASRRWQPRLSERQWTTRTAVERLLYYDEGPTFPCEERTRGARCPIDVRAGTTPEQPYAPLDRLGLQALPVRRPGPERLHAGPGSRSPRAAGSERRGQIDADADSRHRHPS